MCQRFNEWREVIRDYCDKNGLSFEKAQSMVKSSNDQMLVLQYFNPKEEQACKGLADETPMPVVLWVFKKDGKFEFQQTEFTKEYLVS